MEAQVGGDEVSMGNRRGRQGVWDHFLHGSSGSTPVWESARHPQPQGQGPAFSPCRGMAMAWPLRFSCIALHRMQPVQRPAVLLMACSFGCKQRASPSVDGSELSDRERDGMLNCALMRASLDHWSELQANQQGLNSHKGLGERATTGSKVY